MNSVANQHYTEYKVIQEVYGERKANRSQVPYMNHIDEGMAIIDHFTEESDDIAKRAFCLHPIYQVDEFMNIAQQKGLLRNLSKTTKFFASDYGFIANRYLAKHKLQTDHRFISYGKSQTLKRMLIADKVQNYKDFVKYHYNSHPNSEHLNNYFISWFYGLADGDFHQANVYFRYSVELMGDMPYSIEELIPNEEKLRNVVVLS